jgi:hypothetical protein
MRLKDFVDAVRTMDRLMRLEEMHGKLIENQSQRIEELIGRITRLEAREQVLIAEAKGAAAAAASAVASQHLSDLSRRFGVLEERSNNSEGNTNRLRSIRSPKKR